MMAKKKSMDIDFSALQEKVQRQFRNLDPNYPSVWPALPKALLYMVVAVAVAALLWFVVLKAIGRSGNFSLDATLAKSSRNNHRINFCKIFVRRLLGRDPLDANLAIVRPRS